MMRLKRLIHHGSSISLATPSSRIVIHGQDKPVPLPSPLLAQYSTNPFSNVFKKGSEEEIKKERARISEDLCRGYAADMAELKKHGGKIAPANKIIIPAITASKFPSLEVNYPDGRTLKLPIILNGNVTKDNVMPNPKASLLCLSFREFSQPMVNSWSMPFLDTFSASKDVELYEVAFIDSKILCWKPIKRLLLPKMMSYKPNENALQRQKVYSFGDHYDFRKELGILNLITGYIFLLDKFGRIRWQGTGLASEEELASLISCTTLLLEEK
uniref:AT1G08220-like protein n=1 Tax=California macrophylla TaxID=337344 RepID=A0A0G4AN57_9ROSI|nr:AT1G08220-like protein [California macrophylla]